ncbi:MAG: hypothetical protein CMI16_03115 [Opitutaceae bacterium]|nr:hypothetical protein [Opitutaceae bacterium]
MKKQPSSVQLINALVVVKPFSSREQLLPLHLCKKNFHTAASTTLSRFLSLALSFLPSFLPSFGRGGTRARATNDDDNDDSTQCSFLHTYNLRNKKTNVRTTDTQFVTPSVAIPPPSRVLCRVVVGSLLA